MGPMPLRTASSPHLGSGGTLLNVPGPPSGPPDAQALHHPLLSCHPLSVGPQRALPAGGPQPGARRHAWGHLPPTLPRALTAEVRAPPVLRLPPRVGTLAGVLGEGGTGAGGAAAQVLGAGSHIHLGIHQPVAWSEGGAQQGAAAEALLGDRTEAVSSLGLTQGPHPAASPRPGSPLPCGPSIPHCPSSHPSLHPPLLPPLCLSIQASTQWASCPPTPTPHILLNP